MSWRQDSNPQFSFWRDVGPCALFYGKLSDPAADDSRRTRRKCTILDSHKFPQNWVPATTADPGRIET